MTTGLAGRPLVFLSAAGSTRPGRPFFRRLRGDLPCAARPGLTPSPGRCAGGCGGTRPHQHLADYDDNATRAEGLPDIRATLGVRPGPSRE
ncbi:hypothetical protein FLW53_01490 [Microbispora sp. SCL1-1]|nr:hypothetical protein FLW53_01490 [Microbispora sp. SCL1-1]